LPRKFINRRSDAEKAKIASDDEWGHIVDLGEDNKKLDIHDALDVQDRSFFINDESKPVPRSAVPCTDRASLA